MRAFFLLLSISVFFQLQAQIIFTQTYPTAESDIATCLRPTDAGYVISGDRLLSVDSDGNELLSIDGLHNRASYIPADGGFIAARYGYGAASTNGRVLRYVNTGDVLWDRLIEHGLWRNGVEDVISLDDGMFIYAGRHQDVVGSGAVIRKLCPSGGTVWSEIWNLDSWFESHALELFLSGTELYVSGIADAGLVSVDPVRDLMLMKHNLATGDLTWDYLYQQDSAQHPEDLLVLTGGDLLLLGNSNEGISQSGVLVSLTDQDSAVIENWVQLYPFSGSGKFKAIEETADGGFLVMGHRGADSVFTFVKKMDASFTEEWEYVFENEGAVHQGAEMVANADGTYTIAGFYTANSTGIENYFLTKFDLTNLNDTTSVGIFGPNALPVFDVNLYPNPAHLRLEIELGRKVITAPLRATIFDAQGKLKDRFEIPLSGRANYDVSNFDSGIYWLELLSDEGRAVQKFVVK